MRLASPPFLLAEWREEARLVDLRYAGEVTLGDAEADDTLRWLDGIVAQKGRDIGFLVDATHVQDASFAYRQRMGAWFRAHAPHARIAVYNMTPFVRVMALLFSKGARVPVKVAASREEALRWLKPVSAR